MAYTEVTLAELQVAMRRRWDQSLFWTDEEARLAINEALRLWNLLVGRWFTTLAIATVAGQVTYDLDATLLYASRLRYTDGAPIFPTSVLELDLARPTWRAETVADGGDVPPTVTLWAPLSLRQIVIWPATAAVDALSLEGVAATPVLVEAGDTIDLGQELEDTLLSFALHVVAFKEGGTRWQATLPYFDAFIQAAIESNGRLKANKAFRRWAGLDRRRDLQKLRGVPTRLAPVGTDQGDQP